ELTRLRLPLFWFLGDELSSAALSMHWDENFFLEMIATPTLDTAPEKASRIFASRVEQLPAKLQQYVGTLDAQPYGLELVTRLPSMLRKLAAYTRSSSDADHTVLRCYLPLPAGHNLLMAAELTLVESPSKASRLVSAAPSADSANQTSSVRE